MPRHPCSGGALGAVIAVLALQILPLGAAEVLRIEGAWVRAMPPTQRMTAAYLSCVNTGDAPVTLLGARADVGGHASLHATRRNGDRVSMEALESIVLEPGRRLVLEPGGLHLMLMDMPRMPTPGETVELCLVSSVGSHCVAAPVRREAADVSGRHRHDHSGNVESGV